MSVDLEHQVDLEEKPSDVVNCKKGGCGTFGIQAGTTGLKVRETSNLDVEVYNVANYYHTSGFAQALARSETFSNVTLGVIAVNAIYIGVDAEHNQESVLFRAAWPFQVCENLFCVFFCFEWAVRFCAFAKKRDCLRDLWFKFDSALVVLMVFETWLMPLILFCSDSNSSTLPTGPLRLLRLLRLTRMARLMRSLPELVTMVKGMRAGARAVGSSLLMVALLIYVFAIVMHMLVKDVEVVKPHFETLPLCMWTLLMDGTLLDSTGALLTKLIYEARVNTSLAVCTFMVFTLLSAITVMNMLIGVLCEVVSTVAAAEKDEAAINMMKESILVELHRFDIDGNGMISLEELQHVMNDPHALGVLRSLEVDVQYLRELQRLLFPRPDTLVSIESIMDLMLMCRGDLVTTVKHMASGQAFTRFLLSSEIQSLEERVLKGFRELTTTVQSVSRPPGPHRLAADDAGKGC